MARDDAPSDFPLSPDEISKTISSNLPALDTDRGQSLTQLSHVRSAKSRSLAREQTLLLRKHGDTPPARVADAKNRLAVNEQFRREIAVVHELTETPAPEPAANAMIVHGFVRRRSDHAGLPGLTLALTDTEGNWIRELGYTCTDKRGYFLLESPLGGQTPGDKTGDIKPSAGTSIEAAKREAEARASREEKSGPASAAAPAQARQLQLRVFEAKGQVLHVEKRPVEVRVGHVDYRYILLGDDAPQGACTPPPAKTGGRPSSPGPKAPNEPSPVGTKPGSPLVPTEPRVTGVKPYPQPSSQPPRPTRPGVPLEAIRGIGPKSAEKLRGAGISDVAEYERTPGAEFVKLAGFDKTAPQPGKPETKPAKPTDGKKSPARKPTPKKRKPK